MATLQGLFTYLLGKIFFLSFHSELDAVKALAQHFIDFLMTEWMEHLPVELQSRCSISSRVKPMT